MGERGPRSLGSCTEAGVIGITLVSACKGRYLRTDKVRMQGGATMRWRIASDGSQ
jgi:hypothetical protein